MVTIKAGGEEKPEREEVVEPLEEPTPESYKERREEKVPDDVPPSIDDEVWSRTVSEDVREAVLVSSDTRFFVDVLEELLGLGVDAAYLHHVGKDQRRFIETFAERVLPEIEA